MRQPAPPLYSGSVQCSGSGQSQRTRLEETARVERYAALERVRQEHAADWIVTAHHSDDLIEDIMLRLVRGTGWPGLGGMVGVDEKRHILRPLLNWEKKISMLLLWSVDCPGAKTQAI